MRINLARSIQLLFVLSILVILSAGCKVKATPSPTQAQTSPGESGISVTPSPAILPPTETNTAIPEPPSPTATNSPTNTQAPTPTPTIPPPVIPIGGIELHHITDRGGLELLQGSNTYWVRLNNIFWSLVESEEGERNWDAVANIELELINASEQGYEVIFILRDSPAWARSFPKYSCGPVKQDKLDRYGSFVYDVVTRYSVPPYNVRYWELGNEPDVSPKFVKPDNQFGCWGDPNDLYYGGDYYAEMLKVVYPKIKAADPQAQVLVGGLLLDCDPINPPETSPGSGELKDCKPATFLEGILQNGGGDFFDGVSFHAYDYYYESLGLYGNANWQTSSLTEGPCIAAKAAYLRSILEGYGHPDKYLINTETALLCSKIDQPVCKSEDFNHTKASYLAQSYASALANGLRGNIWYSIVGWLGSGLTDNMTPLPALDAYHVSLNLLNEATFSQEITQYPQITGFEFTRPDSRLWVIWGLGDTNQTIQLPSIPTSISDIYGNPLSASQDIELTFSPIYIAFEP
jgi:hypothetical protein